MKSGEEIQKAIKEMEKDKKFANSEKSNCPWTKGEELQLRILYWVLD